MKHNLIIILFVVAGICTITSVYGNSQEILSNTTISNVSINETETSADPIPFRLPSSVIPRHYKLEVLHLLDEVIGVQNTSTTYERFTAPGKVWITVDVVQPTKNITLHAEELEIGSLKVTSLENSSVIVEVLEKTEVSEVQFLILHLESEIPVGQYEIYVEFTSRIADYRLNGLYLDYYDDPKSKERRYIATTLFAPNHARKAFPCFDEPALRATFDITVGHLQDKYFSMSNGQSVSSRPVEGLPGYVWQSFERTPSMSTYIVAMITCDFVSVERYTDVDGIDDKTNENAIELKIFLPEFMRDYKAKVGHRNDGKEINETSTSFAMSILKEFGDGIKQFSPFPLKKLHSIALPHFYFSAMENWGMMTFKYPVLLSVPSVATTAENFRTLEVIVHEMMHQIFGNLVGLDWWSHVWLKESFSTFYGMLGWPTLFSYEKIYEDSNFPLAFHVSEMRQQAMNFDEGLDTHPLYNEPKDSAAIGAIYTKIPYKKGASIIRMMFDFLHPPGTPYHTKDTSFFNGVKLYVKRMSYKGASQNDLFEAIQDGHEEYVNRTQPSSFPTLELLKNVTIKEIMNTWTIESGYPLVRVKYDKDQQKLILSQEKFVNPYVEEILSQNRTSGNKNSSSADSLWWIPVTFYPKPNLMCSLNLNRKNISGVDYTDVWIPGTQKTISVDFSYPTNGLLVNPTASGYFRVLYDPELLEMLLHADVSYIPVVGAAALLDDYFSLAFASTFKTYAYDINNGELMLKSPDFRFNEFPEYVPLEAALDLSKSLAERLRAATWQSAYLHFSKIYQMLRTRESFQPFKKYVFTLIEKLQKKYNSVLSPPFDPKSELALIVSLHHKIKKVLDPFTCDNNTLKEYNIWRRLGTNPIDANEQEWSYCNLMASASDCGIKSKEVWDFFVDSYNAETYTVAKSRYLRGLSCAREPEYLTQLLNWTLDPSKDLHDTDRVQIVQFVIDNPGGINIAFNFLDNNFEALFKNLSAANPITEGMKTMALYMNTPEDLAKLETFIEKHSTQLGSKKGSLEKLLKQVKLNILWMSEDFASTIETWTTKQNALESTDAAQEKNNSEAELAHLHKATSCFNDISMYNQ